MSNQQPSRNDQAIANGQNSAKYYSPFKPSSYYGQNAAANAASTNVRDQEDDGSLRYHDPAYQKEYLKHQDNMKEKDSHRWDHLNAHDEDIGAEAAANNHPNIAKRGLNVFRSWFGGGASDESKTLGKAEANVAERAEADDSNLDLDRRANNAQSVSQSEGFFGASRDRDNAGGRNTQQEIEDANFRFDSNGQRLFDNNAASLVAGTDNRNNVNTFGSAGVPQKINDESLLMPSAQLQRSALMCKTDLDTFERCVKKFDFNDDRCKADWDSFVACNEAIPTKL